MVAITLAKEGTAEPPTFYWCVPGAVAVDDAPPRVAASDTTTGGAGTGAGAGAGAGAAQPVDADVVMEPVAAGPDRSVGGEATARPLAGATDGASAADRRRLAREARRRKKARRDEAAKSRVAGAFFG